MPIDSIYNVNKNDNYISDEKLLKYNTFPFDVIVIDAGHGGKDNGTSYGKIKEKNITLEISRKIKNILKQINPQMQVVLTRDSDVFIPLHKRIEKAHEVNAKLFISIHCNSYINDSSVNGTEVYTLGTTDSDDNLEVAYRENASVLLENDYDDNYEWHDPSSIEAYIFLATVQNVYIDSSIKIAKKIGENINKLAKLKNRGIKQSGFVILKQTAMPSILIETGFLSNKRDRQRLISEKGQSKIAESIAYAISSL